MLAEVGGRGGGTEGGVVPTDGKFIGRAVEAEVAEVARVEADQADAEEPVPLQLEDPVLVRSPGIGMLLDC